ncbi:MAG TPA: hypothetical protein VGO10_21445 [Baekduia sp.]|nr:hypothetical protein [Baekduia sp.]
MSVTPAAGGDPTGGGVAGAADAGAGVEDGAAGPDTPAPDPPDPPDVGRVPSPPLELEGVPPPALGAVAAGAGSPAAGAPSPPCPCVGRATVDGTRRSDRLRRC